MVHPPVPDTATAAAAVTIAYLVASNALLRRALRRSHATRFGPANVVTSVRSSIVGVVAGLVVLGFAVPVPPALFVALVVPALALDGVDGWVARRTGTVTEVGARFDMEVDAFLLLVLGVRAAPVVGAWVLAIGLMRYAFVAAGWAMPWMRQRLPFRYWRKVAAAAQGTALALVVSGLLPTAAAVTVAAVALALLVESFGRDVVWLGGRAAQVRPRRSEPVHPSGTRART